MIKYITMLLISMTSFAGDGTFYIDIRDLKNGEKEITIEQDNMKTVFCAETLPDTPTELRKFAKELLAKYKKAKGK